MNHESQNIQSYLYCSFHDRPWCLRQLGYISFTVSAVCESHLGLSQRRPFYLSLHTTSDNSSVILHCSFIGWILEVIHLLGSYVLSSLRENIRVYLLFDTALFCFFSNILNIKCVYNYLIIILISGYTIQHLIRRIDQTFCQSV